MPTPSSKPLTLLISSAGRRVELLNCFRADARELGRPLRILATDLKPELSSACAAADAAFAVPRCTDPAFILRLLEICRREGVDLVVPTIDPELLPLANARAAFAQMGTRVIVSGPETIALARNKSETAAFLARQGIPSPRTVPLGELEGDPTLLRFPIVLKRIDGSSSIGLHEASNIDDARRLRLETDRYIAQEKWLGREYTVNLHFDRQGRLRAAVPHWRIETRAGEVSKGRTERVPLLMNLAERVAAALPSPEGPLCFQSIITSAGTGMIFEINARFGGGFPLAHQAGAPFTRWLLEEALELPVTADADWREGVTMLRYDAALFVPA